MKALLMSACLAPALCLAAMADDHHASEKNDLATILTSSQWINGGNSVLTITNIGPYGQFVGTYVNGETESFPCATATDVFQVEGQLNLGEPIGGHNITFAVNWTNPTTECDTVTRWAGNVNQTGDTITTNWVLATDGSTTAMVGTDIFTRD